MESHHIILARDASVVKILGPVIKNVDLQSDLHDARNVSIGSDFRLWACPCSDGRMHYLDRIPERNVIGALSLLAGFVMWEIRFQPP